MGLPEAEQKDLILMANLTDEIDTCAKYLIFFQDVLDKRKEMLQKEKAYVDEYLKSFKIVKPLGFVFTAIFILIFWAICSVYNGSPLLWNEISEFFSDMRTAVQAFIHGLNFENFSGLTFKEIIELISSGVFFDELLELIGNAANDMGIFISGSSLSMSGMPDVFKIPLIIDILYIVIFWVYDVYLVVKFFSNIKSYFRRTKNIKEFWKEKKEITTEKYAKENMPPMQRAFDDKKATLARLFEKYNLDKRLMNRENIQFLKKLADDNKSKNITLKSLEKFVIQNNRIQETVKPELYGKALLMYDNHFPYYSSVNPFTKYKFGKEKPVVSAWAILFWPLKLWKKFTVWWFKTFLALLGIDLDNPSSYRPRHSPSYSGGGSSNGSNDFGSSDNRAKGPQSGYVDASGWWREPGEGYVDASGVWREAGEGYVDASGAWREPGEGYVDSTGVWRYPGEGYVDASGVWRDS